MEAIDWQKGNAEAAARRARYIGLKSDVAALRSNFDKHQEELNKIVDGLLDIKRTFVGSFGLVEMTPRPRLEQKEFDEAFADLYAVTEFLCGMAESFAPKASETYSPAL